MIPVNPVAPFAKQTHPPRTLLASAPDPCSGICGYGILLAGFPFLSRSSVFFFSFFFLLCLEFRDFAIRLSFRSSAYLLRMRDYPIQQVASIPFYRSSVDCVLFVVISLSPLVQSLGSKSFTVQEGGWGTGAY